MVLAWGLARDLYSVSMVLSMGLPSCAYGPSMTLTWYFQMGLPSHGITTVPRGDFHVPWRTWCLQTPWCVHDHLAAGERKQETSVQ